MNKDLTLILMNWKRPKNIPLIVNAIRTQTLRPNIWVIDNSEDQNLNVYLPGDSDLLISIDHNFGNYIRLYYAGFVSTPYVMFIDDDLCPTDDKFVEDLFSIAKNYKDRIVSGWGARVGSEKPPHYVGDLGDAGRKYVIFAKTNCIIFPRRILENLPVISPVHRDRKFFMRSDDMYLALGTYLATNQKHLYCGKFRKRLKGLPQYGAGLEFSPDHFKVREEFANMMFKTKRGN